MGYHQYNEWYLASLGYWVEGTHSGTFKISRENGGDINNGEFISYPTYYYKWKWDYPNLMVSRPVEDLCNLCYTFTHRHKFLADHTIRRSSCDEYDKNGNEQENKGGGEDPDVMEELARIMK